MKKLFYFLCLTVFLSSCGKDDPIEKGTYDDGVFVVNEGPFGSGTGTLTFRGDDGILTQQVFEKENSSAVLGNIAQSMIYHNERYYIVVNNANKIIVTDKNLKAVGEITGLFYPRYIVATGNKAFVSQWGQENNNGGVAVVDLTTLKITKNVATGNGPEYMLLDGNQLLVPNGGSYDPATFAGRPDSTVSVIDINSESVTRTLNVKFNPNSVSKVSGGYLIASAEKSYASADGNLFYVKATDFSVNAVNGATAGSANNFSKIRRVNDTQSVLISNGGEATMLSFDPANVSISNKTALGLGYAVDYNEKRDLIYVSDAKNFSETGEVRTYTKSGVEGIKFAVGIVPGGFCFR